MDNQRKRPIHNLDTHLQNDGHLGNKVKTVESNSATYTEGYVHGRASERSLENKVQDVRAQNTAARGLLLGIALTSLVGLVVGSLFFLARQNEQSAPVTPVIVPSAQPSAQSSPQSNPETTVIERTTNTIREVPTTNQEPPASPIEVRPDIRINIPNSGQPQGSQPNTTQPQSAPTQPQNQTPRSNPSAVPQTTTPQSAQPNTTNSTNSRSLAPNQNQRTTPTTQPNTTNPTSVTSSQNQRTTGNNTGTTTTTPSSTTNSNLGTPTQNQNPNNTDTNANPDS
ncbi:MAG TPA: hypothetical protein DDZ80_10705 [Cyanobacteria bacterium UBA8803]|nr:hypothetical protein [Cyanobacteria bacterium UBA9273]HBL58961.1 hypothetical protein [Cyanobacteria bacterium UBA8803]